MPVEVRRRRTRPGSNVVSREPEALEHVPAEQRLERLAGRGLEHEAEREVVRARVGVALAALAPVRERDERARTTRRPLRIARLVRVVVEARRVAEEIAHRDPIAVAQQAGRMTIERDRRASSTPASASVSVSAATNVFVTLPTRKRSPRTAVSAAKLGDVVALARADEHTRHAPARPPRPLPSRATGPSSSRVATTAVTATAAIGADARRPEAAHGGAESTQPRAPARPQLGVGTTSPTSASRATSAA